MDKNVIEKMFSEAVVAKLQRSKANGTIAQWNMSDHLDTATKVIAKAFDEFVGDDDKDQAMLREVVQATYNHSAFAQKLDKMFDVKDNTVGHFRREKKAERIASTYGVDVAALLKE